MQVPVVWGGPCPVASEMRAFQLARRVLATLPPSPHTTLRLAQTWASRVDKVGRLAQTWASRVDKVGRLARLRDSASNPCTLVEDTPVLVQERVQGQVACVLRVGRDSSRQTTIDTSSSSSSSSVFSASRALTALARHSVGVTRGQAVIAGAKGVVTRDDVTSHVTITVTSLTVHSVDGGYGARDEGAEGVRRCTALLCPHPRPNRRPAGLTPPSQNVAPPPYTVTSHTNSITPPPYSIAPPTYDAAGVTSQHDHPLTPSAPPLMPSPLTPSAPPLTPVADAPPPLFQQGEQQPLGVREAGQTDNLAALSKALGVIKELVTRDDSLRGHVPEDLLVTLLGDPPSYSLQPS